MMGANGAVLFSLLIYAALLYGAVRLIKYFIRYGIDYYFQKLEQQLEQSRDEAERLMLTDRIRTLGIMWRETRDLAVLCEHYYDRGYRRNARYTL